MIKQKIKDFDLRDFIYNLDTEYDYDCSNQIETKKGTITFGNEDDEFVTIEVKHEATYRQKTGNHFTPDYLDFIDEDFDFEIVENQTNYSKELIGNLFNRLEWRQE